MAQKIVFVCPWTKKEFDQDDPKLHGLGNPPRSPHEPVGMGGIPMQRKIVEVPDAKPNETQPTK